MKLQPRKVLAWLIPLILLTGLLFWFRARSSAPAGPDADTTCPTFEFEPRQTRPTEPSAPERTIRIPGYTVIPVAVDTETVRIDLYNPEENEVHFQISFYLKESGELLYESRLLAPGQHLYEITLNRPLPPGDYDVTIHYSTFAADGSFAPRNGADVDCVIRAGA